MLLIVCIFVNSCGIYKKVDARKTSTVGEERARTNVEEGRGISIKGLRKGRGTSYEFATSNPMWRASLEILDFIPLSTIDYSGGMIISDWYQDGVGSDAIKISIRFLSNEIAANNLKIIIHEKRCNKNQSCSTVLLERSKIKEELLTSIIKKAALFEKEAKKK